MINSADKCVVLKVISESRNIYVTLSIKIDGAHLRVFGKHPDGDDDDNDVRDEITSFITKTGKLSDEVDLCYEELKETSSKRVLSLAYRARKPPKLCDSDEALFDTKN